MRSQPSRPPRKTDGVEVRRVLIVSASIGGGHDGVAAELAVRLGMAGVASEKVDFLDQLPFGIGWIGRWLYETALRFAPGSYEAIYQSWLRWGWAWRPMTMVVTMGSRRRLGRRVLKIRPDVVVSVYPLASLAIGRMRAKGWLTVPTVTYLTDFSAHPLWLHPGIDLHLAISDAALQAALDGGASDAALVRPLVRPAFAASIDRVAARAAIGVEPGDVAVLLVSGSWGVGAIVDAVETIGRFGKFRVVCVCGRNERLRQELEAQGVAIVIGWTDRMAEIMAACDVVVENAGGLTCMEALTIGLPVITFDPIAGHGRHNARVMAEAGVVRYAQDGLELRSALEAATDHRSPHAVVGLPGSDDAAAHVRALAAAPRLHPTRRLVRQPIVLRRLAGVAATLAVLYLSATVVFGVATAHGLALGVNATGNDINRPTIVGIQLRANQLVDPAVQDALADAHVVAVVDSQAACAAGTAIKAGGVTLANAGDGTDHDFAWSAAHANIEEAALTIRTCTGVTPVGYVSLGRPTAFDAVFARGTPGRTVLSPTIVGADTPFVNLARHRLYVVDGTHETRVEVIGTIDRLAAAEHNHEVAGFPGQL